jgi:hypothetical protein
MIVAVGPQEAQTQFCGHTIWNVDAHDYGRRFVVRADEILTAFEKLQRAIHEFAVSLIL